MAIVTPRSSDDPEDAGTVDDELKPTFGMQTDEEKEAIPLVDERDSAPTPATEGLPDLQAPEVGDESRDSPEAVPPAEDAPEAVEAQDPMEGILAAASDPGDDLSRLAKLAVGSGVRASGVLPGAAAGATVGAMAPPPFTPFTTLGGLVLGGVGGWLAGDYAADALEANGYAIGDPMDLPPHLRSMGVFVESFSSATTGIGGTLALGRTGMRVGGTSIVGNYLNRLLDTARRQPFQTFLAEESAALSGATAAYYTEQILPGDVPARLVAEITAGFFNPTRVAIAAGQKAFDLGRKLISRYSEGARLHLGGRLFVEFIERSGGDPHILMQMLADSDEIVRHVPEFEGTFAQRIGDERTAVLEAELRERSRDFFIEAEEKATKTLRALGNAILMLRRDGSAAALRTASELYQLRHRVRLQGLFDRAELTATLAAQDLIREHGDALTLDQVGTVMKEVVDRAVKRTRDVERQMWDDAVKWLGGDEARGGWRAFRRTYASLRGEADATPGVRGLHPDVEAAYSDIIDSLDILRKADAGEDFAPEIIARARQLTSVRAIHNLRSRFLEQARDAAEGSPDSKAAREFGLLSSALLDDLVAAGAATKHTNRGLRGAGGKFAGGRTPYDDARDFSREAAGVFERSFVGASQRQVEYGLAMPPETFARVAFASGREQALLQMREVQEAIRHLPTRRELDPIAAQLMDDDVRLMVNMQERTLRSMVMEGATEVRRIGEHGQEARFLNLGGVQRFLDRNGTLLKRHFPELLNQLQAAVKDEHTFRRFQDRIKGVRKRLDSDHPTARLLKVESPAKMIQGVLNSDRPIERLTELVEFARKAGPDEFDGMRKAVWEFLADVAATDSGGEEIINISRLLTAFESPIQPGLPSIREFMLQTGLMTAEDAQHYEKLREMVTRVLTAIGTRPTGEAVTQGFDRIQETIARGVGASLARFGLHTLTPGGASTGPTLIVSGQGAQAAMEFLDRIPNLHVQTFLIAALRGDPLEPGGAPFSLLAEMVRRADTVPRQIQKALRLHAYAWTAGLLSGEDHFVDGRRPENRDMSGLPPSLQPLTMEERQRLHRRDLTRELDQINEIVESGERERRRLLNPQ